MNSLSKDQKGKASYVVFLIFFYFFIFRDYLEDVIPVFGYVDECFALLAVPIVVFWFFNRNGRNEGKKSPYFVYGVTVFICLFIFVVLGLISSLIYQYQPFLSVALPDAFLCVKYWLSMITGAFLFSSLSLAQYGNRIYHHVQFVTILYFVLFIVDRIFDIWPKYERRGLLSNQLFYSHEIVLCGCCVFLIVVLLMVKEYAPKYWIWLLLLLLMISTTLKTKSLCTAVVIFAICAIVFCFRKQIKTWMVLVIAPIVLAIAWPRIYTFFIGSEKTEKARYLFYTVAPELANERFPLGCGFGTFASALSGSHYSPLYAMYGMDQVKGLTQENPSFVSDTFWPMILGQTGWIGLVCYIVVVVALFLVIQKLWKVNTSFYAAALCGLAYELIASTAEAAFVHPLAIPIAAVMGYMIHKSAVQDNGTT